MDAHAPTALEVNQRALPFRLGLLMLEANGKGRTAALEILTATDAVGAMIRENKMEQLMSAMQTGKRYGMQTLEDHLNKPVANGAITYEEAVSKATVPDVIVAPGTVRKPARTLSWYAG